MKKLTLVVAIVLMLAPPPLWACAPAFRCHAQKAVVVPVVTPLYIAVPYFVSYDPAADALLAELRAIRAELQKRGPGQDNTTGLQVLQARCASCHSDKAEKGKGFALFDAGKPTPLSLNEKRKIARAIGHEAGVKAMPPPPATPLTLSEKTLVEQYLNGEEK